MAGADRVASSQGRLELCEHPRILQQDTLNQLISPSYPFKPRGFPSPCCYTCLTLSHPGSHQGLFRCPVAQLTAHHTGCSQVPLLVTHGAPLPVA